jgi:hypothetical protein
MYHSGMESSSKTSRPPARMDVIEPAPVTLHCEKPLGSVALTGSVHRPRSNSPLQVHICSTSAMSFVGQEPSAARGIEQQLASQEASGSTT